MLEITRLRLKLILRQPMLLVIMTLVPVVFISFVSLINFGGPAPEAETTMVLVHLGLVDLDHSEVAGDFASLLKGDERVQVTGFDTREAAVTELKNGRLSAVVLIPDGLGAAVAEQGKARVQLVEDRVSPLPSLAGEIVTQAVQRFSARLSTATLAADFTQGAPLGPLSWAEAYELTGELWSPRPPLNIVERTYSVPAETSEVEEEEAPQDVVAFVAPGYVVMFILMLASIGASSLITERQQGTLSRLVAAPVSRLQIMAGNALAIGVQGLFQAVALFAFASLVFGMSLGNSPVALVTIVLSFLVFAVGFGMLIASVVKTPAQAGAAGSLVVLILSFIGGVWWPVEMMPRAMQLVARVTPTFWAGQGLMNVLARGQGLASVAGYSTYLLVLGALTLVLGSWLLSRQEV